MYDGYDEIPKNPVGYCLLAIACGIVGVVIVFTAKDLALVSLGLGAIGMVVGGYAIGLSNHFPTKDRVQFMGLSAVGIMVSVIAFMFGFAYAFT